MPAVNPSLKQQAHELIERLPEDSEWADLAYQFALLASVERGVADVDAGRVVDGKDVLRWIESWGTDHELPPPGG